MEKCVVCGKDCIAMCPRCKAKVHHAYGQNNANCSSVHDQRCMEPSEKKKSDQAPPKEAGKAKAGKK